MFVCLCEAWFLIDAHKNKKKKGKKKLTFHLPSDEERKKNALLDDTARLHPLPLRNKKKRAITRRVRTIRFLQNAKVVSFRTIHLRVEKRGGFGFWIFFFFS